MTAATALRKPRDYQAEMDAAVHEQWSGGTTATAGVAATGLGKGDLIGKMATDAAADVGPVLVFAHREELLTQIIGRCQAYRPDVPVGLVQASTNQLRRPITVASAPTLAARLGTIEKQRAILADPGQRGQHNRARAKMQAAALKLPAKPKVVIVDEGHHASSPGQMRILEWAGAIPPGGWNKDGTATDPKGNPFTPTALLLGVTATLTRADKRGLGMVYRSVAFDRGTLWAITHGPHPEDNTVTVPVEQTADGIGWLVRPRGRVVVTSHMDLNKAKTDRKTGDYQDGELGEMVAQDVEEIVRAWCEHADDRLTAAFTPSVASARALAGAFDDHRCERHPDGVAAGEVYGTTKTAERQKTYEALATGKIKVLVCVMTLTEGWDCPPVSCVLMARPTQLPGLYTQIVGRGLRLSPETGKADCLVLDVVGASRTQRLVTLTDLLPGAVYDTLDLDLVPCEVCGGYLGAGAKLAAAAAERGMPPCMCPCDGCGEPTNECTCEVDEAGQVRDPDGGRRRLIGPQEYAEIDLLGGLDESPCNWLVTPGGINFLEVGNRIAAVVPLKSKPGLFRAGHASIYAGNPGVDLTPREGVPMAQARAAVEAWATAQEHYYPRDAPWRRARKAPSAQAIDVAAREGIKRPERYTAGGLADAIAMSRATRRFDG